MKKERELKLEMNEQFVSRAPSAFITTYFTEPPFRSHTPASIVLPPLDFRSRGRCAAGIYSPLKSFTFYLSSREARVVRGNFQGNCAVPAFLTPGEERCSRWWQCKKTRSKILLTGHTKEEYGARVVNRASRMHLRGQLLKYFTGKIKLTFVIIIVISFI